jgi:hypothetical protein
LGRHVDLLGEDEGFSSGEHREQYAGAASSSTAAPRQKPRPRCERLHAI